MPFDIRKKFAAAICMLLIASIMMISSSYAWFTLSTAPEVTGITTSVGANGNLEIALLNAGSFVSTATDLGIVSAVGDSMALQGKSVLESNVTWGNLVDLSSADYGLDQVTLLPSALNLKIDNNAVLNKIDTATATSLLLAPIYGSDGRVISVDQQTSIGKKEGNLIMPYGETVLRNGVGIIGVASTMSVRLQQYQDARTAAQTAINSAKSAANDALAGHASDLTAILLKAARGSQAEGTTFSKANMQVLGAVITDLATANGHVWDAIKQIAIMSTLSAENQTAVGGLSDAELTALATNIGSAANPEALAAITNVRITTELQNAIDNYNTTASHISAAQTKYGPGEGNLNVEASADNATFGYDAAKQLINLIIDNTHVTVNGIVASGTNKDAMQTSIRNRILVDHADIPAVIELNEGSGVFYDLAKSADNYSTITQVDAGEIASGLGDAKVNAQIGTNAAAPILLPTARTNAGTAYTAGGSSGNIIDKYGYAIDFGFRTNAANANLLLQQSGIQRIYSSGTVNNNDTLGGGSYVQFKSFNINKFSLDDVTALMSAVRVVFVEPKFNNGTLVSYDIVAIAAPDITVETNQTTGVKTYTASASSEASKSDSALAANDTLKVPLALYNYTPSIVNGDEVMVTLGAKKTTGEAPNQVDDLTITALTQNEAKKLTAIVYLDGDAVDNTMAANAAKSMSGSVNLQFATDAELVPMENAALREGNNGGNTTPAAPTVDKDNLQAAIDAVSGSTEYSNEVNSGGLHSAVEEATNNALNNTNATQSIVDAATEALIYAYYTKNSTAATTLATSLGLDIDAIVATYSQLNP